MVKIQVEISYEELEQEFLKELENLGSEDLGSERGILATSQDDHVTARRMRLLSDGLILRGWTNRYSRKSQQIIANPKVSVVVEYIQIDGVASVKGNPAGEPEFLEIIRKKLPHRYETLVKSWSTNRNTVVIEIMPKRIALWKYVDPDAGIEEGIYVLNIAKEEAHRIDFRWQSDTSSAPAYWE